MKRDLFTTYCTFLYNQQSAKIREAPTAANPIPSEAEILTGVAGDIQARLSDRASAVVELVAAASIASTSSDGIPSCCDMDSNQEMYYDPYFKSEITCLLYTSPSPRD